MNFLVWYNMLVWQLLTLLTLWLSSYNWIAGVGLGWRRLKFFGWAQCDTDCLMANWDFEWMLEGWWRRLLESFYGVTGSGWRLVLPDPQDGKEWSPCFSVRTRCHFGEEARREGARTVSLIVILGERKIANTLSLLKNYTEWAHQKVLYKLFQPSMSGGHPWKEHWGSQCPHRNLFLPIQ